MIKKKKSNFHTEKKNLIKPSQKKMTTREEETFVTQITDKGLIPMIYKEFLNFRGKKMQNSDSKRTVKNMNKVKKKKPLKMVLSHMKKEDV